MVVGALLWRNLQTLLADEKEYTLTYRAVHFGLLGAALSLLASRADDVCKVYSVQEVIQVK